MKLKEAAEKVLKEDRRTRENGRWLWLFLAKTLREMGFKVWIEIENDIPSPDAMLTERRRILNKQNMFPEDFTPEEGVTYESSNLNKIEIHSD